MKTNLLKKTLALVLSIMVVLTAMGGALSVFAEEASEPEVVVDPYGTEESGILNSSTNKFNSISVESPVNLDFSQGLKYWGNSDNIGVALTEFLVASTDAEGNVTGYGFLPDASRNWEKLSHVRFGANIAAGESYKIFVDYTINPKLESRVIKLIDADGNPIIDESTGAQKTATFTGYQIMYYEYDADGKQLASKSWSNFISNDNVTRGSSICITTGVTGTVSEGATKFMIQFQDTCGADFNRSMAAYLGEGEAPMYINSIKFAKVNVDAEDNADKTYTNLQDKAVLWVDGLPAGGTYENGATVFNRDSIINVAGANNAWSTAFPVVNGFYNGDFSDGLKYWGMRFSGNTQTKIVSDYFEVTAEGTVKFNGATRIDGKTGSTWVGIAKSQFTLPGITKDDVIKLAFNARNLSATDSSITFYLQETVKDNTGESSNVYSTVSGSSGTLNATTDWKKVSTKELTVTSETPIFRIRSQVGTTAGGIEFDDMQILKKEANGTWTDVATGENYYSNGTPVGGTYEDGWSTIGTNTIPTHAGPFAGVQNGDFTQGLKYWGTRNDTGSGSDYAEVKTDGDNTYIYLKGKADVSYRGIRSTLFYLPGVKADDQLVLMYKYRNGDATKFQAFFSPVNNTGSDWVLANNTGSTVKAAATDTEWGYAVANKVLTVGSKISIASDTWMSQHGYVSADYNKYPAYRIEISNSTANQVIDIDDMQIVKYIDDYTYETFDGKTIKFDPAWAGTFEDGASVSTGEQSQMTKYINKDYYVVNGDFSKGLKFWGATGTLGSTCYGSTYVDLITEGDNHYVKFDGVTRTYFNGFKSGIISIPAADLAIGDQVALVFDVYDPDNTGNFQLRLDAADDNGSTVVTAIRYATQIADKGNGWKTYVGKFGTIANASNSTDAYAVKAGDWTYTIAGEVVEETASSAAIDNLKIVKKVTDYSVIDLATDETIEWLPAWVGTFENGAENLHVNSANNEYGVINGDFSEGLKYWGCSGGSISPNYGSTYTSVVTEDGNSYIKFDGVARTYFAGFKSGIISIPASELQVGDYIAVKYDIYDPDNNAKNIQVKIESRCGDGSNSNSMVSAYTLIEDKGNGWKTYATKFQKAIANVSASTNGIKAGDWTYTITASVQGSAIQYEVDEEGKFVLDENGKKIPVLDENGNTIIVEETKCVSTAAIDNISIVRADRGGFGKDALAVALDGSAIGKVNYGDANLDGKVDLVDLVRTKKYVANQASGVAMTSPISLVSVDADGVAGIGAEDIMAIINKILAA